MLLRIPEWVSDMYLATQDTCANALTIFAGLLPNQTPWFVQFLYYLEMDGVHTFKPPHKGFLGHTYVDYWFKAYFNDGDSSLNTSLFANL